jgi:hypothetical protein
VTFDDLARLASTSGSISGKEPHRRLGEQQLRRFLTGCTTLALATAGAVLASPFGSTAAAPSAKPQATAFALAGSGFGTRFTGAQIPAGSELTAFDAIGCTNKAGLTHENHEAQVTVPGLGTLSDVATTVWTQRGPGAVSSYSRHTIGNLALADSPLGSLELNAITSQSRAFHDTRGFHSTTSTNVGSISFTPTGGDPQTFAAPAPGQPVEIPGVATITVGSSATTHSATTARARANALMIDLAATGSKAQVGHTSAQISSGIKSGIFGGWSSGTRISGLDDVVTSGPTPLSIMPCQGTAGLLRANGIAHGNPDDNVVVDGQASRQLASQTSTKATGFERGSVAKANLGHGQLVISDIIGKANVTRTAKGVTRNANGTTVGTILFNGEPQTFPDTGILEIPGVAKLERKIVKRSPTGISVTALRITLLDGSGAVISLGQAKLSIHGSGL